MTTYLCMSASATNESLNANQRIEVTTQAFTQEQIRLSTKSWKQVNYANKVPEVITTTTTTTTKRIENLFVDKLSKQSFI